MSKFVCVWLKHFLHGIYILISSVIWHEFRHVPLNYDHDIPFDCFNPQKMAMFGGYYFLLLKQTTINVLLFLDSRKQFINIYESQLLFNNVLTLQLYSRKNIKCPIDRHNEICKTGIFLYMIFKYRKQNWLYYITTSVHSANSFYFTSICTR